jgi:hypothetical protein
MLSALRLRQGADADELGVTSSWKCLFPLIPDPPSSTAPVYHGVCAARWARLIVDRSVGIADALAMFIEVLNLEYYPVPSFYPRS